MIFGQSGGGGKVSHLMTMPRAQGLFHKAAIQSGSTLQSGDPAAAHEIAERMLAQIGLGKDRVRELQSIPWQMMIGAQMSVGGRLGPILDGEVVPRHPFEPDASPLSADVPLIVGTTLHDSAYRGGDLEMNEAAMLERAREMLGADADRVIRSYREACPDETPALLVGRLSTDRGGRRNAITLCERKAALGRAPVFAYRCDWPSVANGGKFGAVHGVDVPMAFHNPAAWPLTGDGPEALTMADKLAAAWVAFARTGNPSGEGLPDWPAYNPDTRATMIFDVETRVQNDPDVELLRLVGARS
jgi:para-nitrobenzyl esterase